MRSTALALALPLVLFACDSGTGSAPPAHVHASTDVAKVKDPVCGMRVAADSAWKAEFDRADYRFCSEDCRKQFLAAPAKYATACTCAATMKNCDCGHCLGKREPCDCGSEHK